MLISTLLSIVLVAIILLVIIFVLMSLNKKLKKRIQMQRKKLVLYSEKIKDLKKDNPTQKELDNLNKVARDFFKERFGLKYSLTYSDLSKRFKRRNKDKHAQFCDMMNELIYSGKAITSPDINKAINLFIELAENPQVFEI